MNFTCDDCGKEFPANPETMVETGIAVEPGHSLEPQDREGVKDEMDLTDAQLDELMTRGFITTGAACICIECQDKEDE